MGIMTRKVPALTLDNPRDLCTALDTTESRSLPYSTSDLEMERG